MQSVPNRFNRRAMERNRTTLYRNAQPEMEQAGTDKCSSLCDKNRLSLLKVTAHAANIHDTKPGIIVARKTCEKYSSIKAFCTDAGYRGTFVENLKAELQLPSIFLRISSLMNMKSSLGAGFSREHLHG